MRIRRKRRNLSMRRGVYLLPNVCTTASLFCGFYSILQSMNSKFVQAAWFIILAGVFDLFDGRIARIARAESSFGVEYDSLVDLISFGVAPVILIYHWGLVGMNEWGWLAAFIYLACGTLRLARFNVQHKKEEMMHFQGLPIPVAATILSTGVICYHQFFDASKPMHEPIIGVTIALALLMISTVRYRSLKEWDFRHRMSLFALALIAVGVFVIAVKPATALFSMTSAYVIFGLLEWVFRIVFRKPAIPISVVNENKAAPQIAKES